MPKSLKKQTNHLPKTVKLYSQRLTDKEVLAISDLMTNYGKCKDLFYHQLSGINNMLTVREYRKIRNKINKSGLGKKYVERFNFQNKHWRQALFDVCLSLVSMWSNLANQIKHVAMSNDNLNHNERHYLNFVLIFPTLWNAILHHQNVYLVEIPKKYQKVFNDIKLSSVELRHTNSYIRRLTRRYKPSPKVTNNHTMTYEENMYLIKNRIFSFTSAIPRQKFKVKMTSDWRYRKNGNLQIILDSDKKRIEIHKLVKTHFKKVTKKEISGIDKGLYTLLSSSSGNEYGVGFSSIANKHVDRTTDRLRNKQPYLSKRFVLRQKLAEETNKRKRCILKHKLQKLEKNIGFKNYHKQQKRNHSYLESIINHAVNEYLNNERPSLIIKEDLTFTTDKLPKINNRYEKRIRKRLNSWQKGRLDERIEYKAEQRKIKTSDVNPAYTSQYCPLCGYKFTSRYGLHHEKVFCPNCCELNANTAAAKNIKNRYYDKEINLYTPYKNVEKILESIIS